MYIHYFLLVIVLLLTLPLSAREDQKGKRGELEVFNGLNLYGPANPMSGIMIDYHFDRTTYPYWGDRPKEHPDKRGLGMLFGVSYARYIGQKSKVGIVLHIAGLRSVEGYHSIGEDLHVELSSMSIIATYQLDLHPKWEFQTGPSIMFNQSRQRNPESEAYDQDTLISPGLLLGLNAKIWDSRVTYGKIGSRLLITGRVDTGPFIAESIDGETAAIPVSKLGYTHMNLYFALGFHL